MVRFVRAGRPLPRLPDERPVRPLLLLQLVADRRQQQLLRGHRAGLAPHPHLVPGRRGAVLPGLAAGGAGRDAPLAAPLPGASGSCWSLSVVGAVASALEMALLYNPTANTTRLYFGTDTHAQSILVGSVLACSMTIIQMRRGAEGMAPAARSPGRPVGPGPARPGRLGRHPHPHLHAGRHLVVRLPGRVPALGPVGGGHHHRRGVRAPRADRPRPLPAARWCGSAPSPMGPTCGTTRSTSTSTPPGPACPGSHCWPSASPATFALAAASYYLVERPVMYGTFWRSVKAVVPAAVLLVTTVAVVIVGTVAPATAAVQREAVPGACVRTPNPHCWWCWGTARP